MSSLTTSAQCSASDSACRSPPRQVKQVRPKLPLLKILQTAGAQGEIFTVTQVMHYLGQYITMKQLYDPREQHMVYCGGDLLGELLGCQSFSVKDPSPIYAMLRRNLVALTTATAVIRFCEPTYYQPDPSITKNLTCRFNNEHFYNKHFNSSSQQPCEEGLEMKKLRFLNKNAAQTLAIAQDQNLDIPSQDQLKQSAEESCSSRKGTEEGSIPTLPTLQCKQLPTENEDLVENLTQDETSRLDLGLEEWDVAGLPWWFLGNLRNNYTPRSNASTDLQTNRDVGTAIVSDTTDDVWFLNESVSEQFGVGVRVEAAGTEQTSEEVGKVRDKMVIEAGNGDDLEDSQSLCGDTDVEVASEDEWQCTECKKFNSPSKRYCFRCWALRKDWYSDCSKLTHSLSTSDITAMPEEKQNEGIDVPDCRRTISAPVVLPKDGCRKEENPRLFDSCTSVEFLDLAHRSESQETISSMGDQSADLFKQRTVVGKVEDCRNLLKPCSLCEKRPRDGNIIHGKTSHLVTCFHCARRLKKAGASCPICKKEIQLVIRVFIA